MLSEADVNHILFKYDWDENYLVADVTRDLNALFEESYLDPFDAFVNRSVRQIQEHIQAAYEDSRRQE